MLTCHLYDFYFLNYSTGGEDLKEAFEQVCSLAVFKLRVCLI